MSNATTNMVSQEAGSLENNPEHVDSVAKAVPLVQSERQFSTLWHHYPHLRSNLTQLIRNAPPVSGNRVTELELLSFLDRSCTRRDPDSYAYKRLREITHARNQRPTTSHLNSLPHSYNVTVFDQASLARRARSRATSVARLVPYGYHVGTILDIGSSEGSITGAMADIFRIPPSSAFACDVTPLAPHASGTTANKFTFSLLPKDSSILPYQSEFFDLVTCQMTLHHVQDQLGMISEIARVLKPGGILIIREHDMKEPGFRLVLDIMHGLYALVWSDPQEDPAFIATYYANYRSRQDWAGMIKSVGLSSLDQSSSNNNRNHYNAANAYFDAFRKGSAASAIQQDKKRKRDGDDEDEETSTSAPSKRVQGEGDVEILFEHKNKRRSDNEPSFENM